jgi:hypothetical protein
VKFTALAEASTLAALELENEHSSRWLVPLELTRLAAASFSSSHGSRAHRAGLVGLFVAPVSVAWRPVKRSVSAGRTLMKRDVDQSLSPPCRSPSSSRTGDVPSE